MEHGSVDPRKQAHAAGGSGPSESSYPGNAGVGANMNGNGASGGVGGSLGQGSGAFMPSPYLSKELPTSAAVTLPPRSHEPAYDPRARDPAYAEPPRSAPSMPSAVPHHVLPHAPPTASSPAVPTGSTDTIWVRGLPRDVTVEKLANYFGEFGQLKMDRSKDPPAPHINIIPSSSGPGSEARLVWDTPEHAPLAVEYFNGKHWPGGGSISVSLALAGPPAQQMPPAGPPPSYNQPPSYPPQSAYPPPPQHTTAPPTHPNALYQAPPPGYPPYGAMPAPHAYDPYAYQGPPPPTGAPPQSAPYDPYAAPQGYNQPPPPQQGYNPAYPPQQAYPQYGGPPPYANSYPPQQQYGAPPPQQQYGGQGQGGQGNHGGHGQGGPQGGHFQFKGKGGAARAGDWICPACQNNNFSWRTACKQCSLPRPASAAVVDRDEHGAPPRRPQRDPNSHPDSANDWSCPKCGFRNFSKRDFCHDCRTPKPYGQGSHGPVRYTGGADRSRPY